MTDTPKNPEEFDTSDLDITPTELRPVGRGKNPREAQAELDHAALIEIGKRLTAVESRLGIIEGLLHQLVEAWAR